MDDSSLKLTIPRHGTFTEKVDIFFIILDNNEGFKLISQERTKPSILKAPKYAVKCSINAIIESICLHMNYSTQHIFYYDSFQVNKEELPLSLKLDDDEKEKEVQLEVLFRNLRQGASPLNTYKTAQKNGITEGYEIVCTLFSLFLL